jgi:hypothetical protein
MAEHLTTPNGAGTPERRVRSHYTYDWVAFIQNRSKSWIRNNVSLGNIEGKAGRIPLAEVLRLTGLSIEEFTLLYGETMPVDVAS